MDLPLQYKLDNLSDLRIHAARAEIVTWQDRPALRLENGLVLFPSLQVTDARIEVLIGTEGSAYPGIAFRIADTANYELAYAVPHVSGQWDALQYDPIFHGSNTWQLYYGRAYQHTAQVPTDRWFRLRVDVCATRAAISVDGQPPLVVEQLAHPLSAGMLGLWTFLPAHFADLRVSPCTGKEIPPGEVPVAPEGVIESWFVEGYGVVSCEPNGVLNLNRHLPASLGEVRLTRSFELSRDDEVRFEFGFSDELVLELDGEVVFEGERSFQGFADRAARGYAELAEPAVQRRLAAGEHRLDVRLRVKEGFGWGLVFAGHGEGLRWLPVELG
jgi:hypothetical protein